ncbi:MAG: T9SS type A sorting domain-containing protein, partial [Bacteroidales bacterium]|nr:T9SS type A sorting domain-containing protein [Bacteroidales bacterium]
VSQLPNITITGETDICAGESTTLTANGGETYLWSDGTTDNTLTVSTAGTYQVIGYNAAGCNAMASATVTVWQPAASEFSVECPDSCYTWNAQTYCTSGDYTQTFQTVHGCDSVVTLHLTITVGIDDHHLGASMTVYPNPTTGMVNVQCTMNNTQAEKVEFQLFDAFGRLLRTTDGVGANNDSPLRTDGHGSSAQTQIDLSHYASGIYFIKAVADGNAVAVRKVVKR